MFTVAEENVLQQMSTAAASVNTGSHHGWVAR